MTCSTDPSELLSLPVIRQVAQQLEPHILRTPTVLWPSANPEHKPWPAELFVKLELLQKTGSFKPRGAINTINHYRQHVTPGTTVPGVTAFSAGNHAIATAYAAGVYGIPAKVVMPESANPYRVEQCVRLGAELVFGQSIDELLAIVQEIQSKEDYLLVHPFEGVATSQGTATVALELCEDVPSLDAVVIPIGGGGLISGMASTIKQLQPDCRVIGVEPAGANGMQQSVRAGEVKKVVNVSTIADSLGAPMHATFSFDLVRHNVDEIVTVTDDALIQAMRRMFTDMKLAVEPACAAGLAAVMGPLNEQLAGRRVAILACGSNIDFNTYHRLLA